MALLRSGRGPRRNPLGREALPVRVQAHPGATGTPTVGGRRVGACWPPASWHNFREGETPAEPGSGRLVGRLALAIPLPDPMPANGVPEVRQRVHAALTAAGLAQRPCGGCATQTRNTPRPSPRRMRAVSLN